VSDDTSRIHGTRGAPDAAHDRAYGEEGRGREAQAAGGGGSDAATPLVLIAHADPEAIAALATALAADGYPYLSTSDGDAACALARLPGVALVVSDLYLPAAGGPCLVRALRRDATRAVREVPILVFTRRVTPDDCAWAMAEGGDAILGVPAPPASVVAAIRRMAGPAPTVVM
jgi:CheY-like chemotaxis protein